MFPYASSLLLTPPNKAKPNKWIIIVASQGKVCGPLVVYRMCNSTPSTEDNVDEDDIPETEARMRRRSRRKSSSRCYAKHQLKPAKGPLSIQAIIDYRYRSPLQCLLKRCKSWNFDSFLLTRLSYGHPVVALGWHLFHQYDFVRTFALQPQAIFAFLQLIESAYPNNQFHSATHAADVAQAMHCFLNEFNIRTNLSDLEKLACILAAFGHDVYHPGVNQKFWESSQHFLCPLYNNHSVLENFHWRCLISILRQSKLLNHLPNHIWKSLIDLCRTLILATDMQRQQEYLNQFQVFLSDSRKNLQNPSSKQRLMQILIKCADIGNPCRPWKISQEWSYRASTEFFQQGDEERRLKYPVTSFCDRYSTSVPKIQSGFMEFVAEPLFCDWHKYMATPLSKQLLTNLQSNCAHWTQLLKSEIDAGAVSSIRDSTMTLMTAKSSLEEAAEYELQQPEVLQRRRVSASVLLTTPFRRQSTVVPAKCNRRTSLPVASGSVTSWTVRSPGLSDSRVMYTQPHDNQFAVRLQLPTSFMHMMFPPHRIPLPDLPEVQSARGKENNSASKFHEATLRTQYPGRRRHSEPLVTPPPALTNPFNGSPRLTTRRTNNNRFKDSHRSKFDRRGSIPLSLRQLQALQPMDSLHSSCLGVS